MTITVMALSAVLVGLPMVVQVVMPLKLMWLAALINNGTIRAGGGGGGATAAAVALAALADGGNYRPQQWTSYITAVAVVVLPQTSSLTG